MVRNNIREIYKKNRQGLSTQEVFEKSSLVSLNIKALLDDKIGRADSFLCYFPVNNEVDIRSLYEELLGAGARLFFPRTEGADIVFYEVSSLHSDFYIGRFNIMEPMMSLPRFDYNPVDRVVCFTPGLIFDTNCNRMGYGRGYYDRFFADKPGIVKVGLSYEQQLSDSIVVHEGDVSLDYVVTENSIYCSRCGG